MEALVIIGLGLLNFFIFKDLSKKEKEKKTHYGREYAKWALEHCSKNEHFMGEDNTCDVCGKDLSENEVTNKSRNVSIRKKKKV